eukprot:TRINITY_DN22829_c0_g1_i1.p2 TRINITY_DN22829_c0_g1~~TRINITY_DN22829_c0_g1_i1.p2  ORF type:complete len:293 (-),score=24.99 TRINITY_DN22829_c0_g1_i1:316-1194(-)
MGRYCNAATVLWSVCILLTARCANAVSLRWQQTGVNITATAANASDDGSRSNQTGHGNYSGWDWPKEAIGDVSLMTYPCLNGRDECYSAQQRLPPDDALRLYQIAHIVTTLLKRHHVWHTASGGTLLGAVRNKGLIPHDDDVDFNILRSPGSYIVTSAAFKSDLVKNGMFLHKVHDDFWQCKDKGRPGLHVDLFAMITLNGVLTFDHGWWPGTKWPTHIMAPGGLVQWTYGAIKVWGPTRDVAEDHFNRNFGSTWSTEVKCVGSYHKCAIVEDTKYDLTQPAKPFEPVPDVK